MESNDQKQQIYPSLAESQHNYQPQEARYYTQDPNTGAQQVYYTNPPIQYQQVPVQYQQAPVQYVTVVQNRAPQSNINPNCGRCYGAGFDKKGKPCRGCCTAAGVCYKCGGCGTTRKGRPCNNCAYHSNAGIFPACTLKKALSGKNNKPCLVCKTVQRIKM